MCNRTITCCRILHFAVFRFRNVREVARKPRANSWVELKRCPRTSADIGDSVSGISAVAAVEASLLCWHLLSTVVPLSLFVGDPAFTIVFAAPCYAGFPAGTVVFAAPFYAGFPAGTVVFAAPCYAGFPAGTVVFAAPCYAVFPAGTVVFAAPCYAGFPAGTVVFAAPCYAGFPAGAVVFAACY